MNYLFIPYYDEDTPEFKKSLESQTAQFKVIRRNTKKDKIYWTKAVRDFQKEIKGFPDDIVCIMNNDISFNFNLTVKSGEVHIPENCYLTINWKRKKFYQGERIDSFLGRCFYMTLGDFKETKFSPLLPHALSDIDFGIKVLKKLTPVLIQEIHHKEHSYRQKCNRFSLRSYENPILWTYFLLKHWNRYTIINIIKAWL